MGGIVTILLFAAGIVAREPVREKTAAPPLASAVGYPSRAPDLDVLPGFRNPPPGYGEVGFYWWQGEPLTRERILWQLDQLKGKSISGLQINYAHSDQGGRSYGLTYPSEPPLFSEAWWSLFAWFQKECKKRGWATSLSDYTLATPGQGWWTDEIIRENPDMAGSVLQCLTREVSGPGDVVWDLPEQPLSVAAYLLQGGTLREGSRVDLRGLVSGSGLHWRAPRGSWKLAAVTVRREPLSFDPMNPQAGKKHIEKFFQRFEDRLPGEGGKGLNFFFSDELTFGVKGNLWNDRFAEEFRRRKGYDLIPELPALFLDTGPRAPKVRLDYRDVLVSLCEENYFRPIFLWHSRRGMLYGCDHGWRGRDVLEFGDYFRTQRWTTGPGNDQPRLESDIVKNKVASSIAHLYQRPRAWLEGYYGSGWGTSTADITDATFRNYVMGHTLLTLHGLYYTTYGGFWEWAPPCNHFHMPYWSHMGEFLRCVERLSYLLSQGVHRCDVAVVYPVAPMEAGINGKESTDAAFTLAPILFDRGIDFDFIDFESLARAQIKKKELRVSGEAYRVLILPAMAAVRFSTLRKAREFYCAGGTVLAVGALPEASERVGRNDPLLDGMVREIFGVTAADARSLTSPQIRRNHAGGRGVLAQNPQQVVDAIRRAIVPDFELLSEPDPGRPAQVLHRRAGGRDVYMVLGVPKNSLCFFRAKGRLELWNPWTGGVSPLHRFFVTEGGTRVRMPLESNEAQLIVFHPGRAESAVEETNLDEVTLVEGSGGHVRVRGLAFTGGEKFAKVRKAGRILEVHGGSAISGPVVRLDGLWDFELNPTLDNRWGDFRIPASNAMIGAEARQFRYAEEISPDVPWYQADLDDSQWRKTTVSFGPRFWKLGPLPENAVTASSETRLADVRQMDPSGKMEINGTAFQWFPYEFSMRWGNEEDPGHQGYHGLKENVGDDFICLGTPRWASREYVYDPEPGGSRYYLWTSVFSPLVREVRILSGGIRPSAVFLDGAALKELTRTIRLSSGFHSLLLRYDGVGRGHFVFENVDAAPETPRLPLAMRWYRNQNVLLFDIKPGGTRKAGWYRFDSPPGFRSMKFLAHGKVRAWADGHELSVEPGPICGDGAREYKASVVRANPLSVPVALRIEPQSGYYAGAAVPEPALLECGNGRAPLGDWAKTGALETYSGGAWYRKSFKLLAEQTAGQVVLDMGDVVASAEVRVNGLAAGIRVAPPWRLDISRFVRTGENRIEILVCNTLANHYLTIPTRYHGATRSGLLGPVTIRTRVPVVLR
jgi:hypothetical protein